MPRRRLSDWPLLATAAAILMVTMGARQSIGLYLSPINTSTGLGIARISLAMAIGQFVGKLFGTRYLARFGNYSWMWYADIALALGAALINLPIQEAQVRPVVAAATT
jgi:hypothetical protein